MYQYAEHTLSRQTLYNRCILLRLTSGFVNPQDEKEETEEIKKIPSLPIPATRLAGLTLL